MLQEWVLIRCLEGLLSSSQCELFQLPAPFPAIKSGSCRAQQFLKQAILLKNGGQEGEVEGHKLDTGPMVEFVLKLHPEFKQQRKQELFNEGSLNDDEG